MVNTGTAGLKCNDLIVPRHTQKGQQDSGHHRHGDNELQKKRHGVKQHAQHHQQADFIVDDVIGDIEDLGHQKNEQQKTDIDNEGLQHLL